MRFLHRCDEGERAEPGINYGFAGGPRLRIVVPFHGKRHELYIRWSKIRRRLFVDLCNYPA